MALPSTNFDFKIKNNIHRIGWRQSIMDQLQLRKSIEQNQFEDICSFANNMFDRVDIYKTENIQLNLKCEHLQQQLLGIQQTILAGGSDAAKTVLSKLSTVVDHSSDTTGSTGNIENLSLQNASLLSEKSQLEKKILDLQEKIADVHKTKSDTVQKVIDLKTEIEEKDRVIRQLKLELNNKDAEIHELSTILKELENKHNTLENKNKTLDDEYTALTFAYKSLEKKHHALQIDCDVLSKQIMAIKREDAERLNAENDKILELQREKQRLKLEANVVAMNKAQLARQSAGDPGALNLGAMALADNFETLDDDLYPAINTHSRIPKGVAFSFDAHDGEAYAIHWYSLGSPKEAFLATGGADRKVKIWKIDNDESIYEATLTGCNASITSIDVDLDFILASSHDYATRIWSINGYKSKQTLTGHSAKVSSAKFLDFKTRVASGSADRTIKVWDVNQGVCLKTYFALSSCFDLVYNNNQLITCHFDSKIRFWDLNQPTNNETIAQILLQSKITSLDVSRDGTKLLCSLRDDTIKLLDIRKMEVIQTYSDEKFKIGADNVRAKFSVEGQYICCGSNDGSMYIWDTNTAKVERVSSGHTNTLIASCWSPDGERMVSIERGRKVSIWA